MYGFFYAKNEWLFIRKGKLFMMGLIHSVEETARQRPDSIAYVFEETAVSYREFVEKFHRAAGALECTRHS